MASRQGTSQFCPGDSIMLIDKQTSEVFKLATSIDRRSPWKDSPTRLPKVSGRGEDLSDAWVDHVSYLQDLKTLDIKVGDYYEGGIIIWFDPSRPWAASA